MSPNTDLNVTLSISRWFYVGICFFSSMLPTLGTENSLGRTWEQLATHRQLTIGYFGGSITEGACASDPAKTSWRALTTAWFKSQFPDAKIDEVNAAIGGTGTDLGIFRCQHDLLSHHPDLIFIEFAVNDALMPEARELSNMEGIVRQIRTALPKSEIIFVYTMNRDTETYSKGKTPATVLVQQKVADYYGIPSVNVGKVLWQTIQDKQGTWETLTKEGTHPLDSGYEIYFQAVKAFLEAHRHDVAVAPGKLPPPLSPNPAVQAKMIAAYDLTVPGWTKEQISLAGRLPNRIAANVPGTTLDFHFTGTTIGIYWLMASDSGMIDYSIDDGPKKTISAWDVFCLSIPSRANSALLGDNLPPGPHTLHLAVSVKKDPQSTGTWIRIGAFLVK